jgi:serine-type D-Ala-D-Ala carboxypeptidase
MGRLQELLEWGRAEGLYPGGVFAIVDRTGKVLDSGATGESQVDPAIQAGEETIWDLASLTKPMATATSVLLLAQAGEVHLGQEVRQFLPEAAALEGVTLRHCLTHTAGFKAWEPLFERVQGREAIIRVVANLARQSPIGSRYVYSDFGYILLGEVVGRVAGQPLEAFALERIFRPLGMNDTCYCPPDTAFNRIAATRCLYRNRVLLGDVHDGNCAALSGIAGHAGLFGTLPDVCRYARMLLGEGELAGVRLLAPLAARQMLANQNPPPLWPHTFGWFASGNPMTPAGDLFPPDAVGHTGYTGTSAVLSPSLGVAVVLLTNRVYYAREAPDFLHFRRRFHNAAAGSLPA